MERNCELNQCCCPADYLTTNHHDCRPQMNCLIHTPPRYCIMHATACQMQLLKTTNWSIFTHNNGHHTTTGKGIPVHTCSRETWRTCVCSAKSHDSLSLELCISPAPWHHALSEWHNNMPLSAKHLNYSHWIYTTQHVASEQLQARYPVTLLHVA